MPWTMFVQCAKGNCSRCPGKVMADEDQEIICACPHHHLPQAQVKTGGGAVIICFGCRTEVPADELHVHSHLDIGEDLEDGTGSSMGHIRLPEVRELLDRPPTTCRESTP